MGDSRPYWNEYCDSTALPLETNDEMSGRPLRIPTLDARLAGGVTSVARFTYRAADSAGFEPRLVYNAMPWDDCLTVRDLLRADFNVPVEETNVDGLQSTQVGRVLPEFEVFDYVLNYPVWRDELDGATVFGVGGTCLPCLPAALAGDRFGCWIGTTLEDERAVQREAMGPAWQARYALTRPVLSKYERYVLNNAAHVFVQSKYAKRRVVERHGIASARIERVPFPIDTTTFAPGEDSRNGNEILFVGRLNDPRKDVATLLRAFAQVLESVPSATLTLVGDEPTTQLRQQATELGLDDRVVFAGKVPDVVSYYQRADVFVLPSRQEGLGIVGLEAMSCGLPVVSTTCGGPEEYVINDETGYLVPRGDPARLASRLVDVLSDESLARELGNAARAFVVSNYDADEVGDELEWVLERVATGER